MTLADLPISFAGLITGFTKQGETLNRLHSMGVIPGAKAMVLRSAPFGDPIQVKIDGGLFSIRKQDALQIEVETI